MIGADVDDANVANAIRRPSRDGTGSPGRSDAGAIVTREPVAGSRDRTLPSAARYMRTPLPATPKGGGTRVCEPTYTTRLAAISNASNARTTIGRQGTDRDVSGRA